MRHAVPVCVLLCVFGCSKKPDETGGGGDSGTTSKKEEVKESNGYPDRVGAPAGKVVRGDVEVQVRAAGYHNKQHFIVTVRVAALNKDKLFNFKGWGGDTKAVLTDDKGNNYPQLPLTPDFEKDLRQLVERDDKLGYGAGPVYHDRPRAQLIGFHRPVTTAEYVDLDLDGVAVGSRDPIRFRIAKTAWRKSDGNTETKD